MAQGYYVSRPLAAERVLPWLEEFAGELAHPGTPCKLTPKAVRRGIGGWGSWPCAGSWDSCWWQRWPLLAGVAADPDP